MIKALASGLGIALLVVLAGCEYGPTPTCTASWEPGLAVTILDSLTGEPPLESATTLAVDGAYMDTLDDYGPDWPKLGAWERAGTYDLRVTAPGYLEWTRTLIQVTSDGCHVHTVEIEARLMRDPDGNLILNGSFEGYGQGSLAGWDVVNPTAVSSVDEGAPGAGSSSAQCSANGAPTSAIVFQKVSGLHDGDVVELEAAVRAFGPGGGGSMALVVGTSPWLGRSREVSSSGDSWSTLTVRDTLALGTADSVWVWLSAFPVEVSIATSGVLFDSVVLTRVAPGA